MVKKHLLLLKPELSPVQGIQWLLWLVHDELFSFLPFLSRPPI
jgi:hypothetical protein